jgi:predicted CXXCH cytochrome family protein
MADGVPPKQKTPGGDFGWLKKSYAFAVRGTTTAEDGATHGHNIVAADFGYVVDPTNGTSPGGTFPSGQLACNSCHDPHGKYRRTSAATTTIVTAGAPIISSGSYSDSPVPAAGQAVGAFRLLAGAGYTKGGITFPGAPMAVAPPAFNRTEAANQTRVAYGHQIINGVRTWGDWCGACHPNMHAPGGSRPSRHPVDRTMGSGGIANLYNQYRKSGDLTGDGANSYTTLVPFTEATASFTVLRTHARSDGTFLNGPAFSDRVTCLSCHRAHASGFPQMLRWQMEGEFIVYDSNYPGIDNHPHRAAARAWADRIGEPGGLLRPPGDAVRIVSAGALQQVPRPGLIGGESPGISRSRRNGKGRLGRWESGPFSFMLKSLHGKVDRVCGGNG